MKNQDSLVGLQETVAELERQKLEVEQNLENARRAVQKGRVAIVAALEKTIATHQAEMAKEVAATLERLGMQTAVTITLELSDNGKLMLKGFDLGAGAGEPSRTNMPILKKDWSCIFGFPWNERGTQELKQFQCAKDGIVPAAQSMTVTRGAINFKMKMRSLPYRILVTDPSIGTRTKENRRYYKIYIVV